MGAEHSRAAGAECAPQQPQQVQVRREADSFTCESCRQQLYATQGVMSSERRSLPNYSNYVNNHPSATSTNKLLLSYSCSGKLIRKSDEALEIDCRNDIENQPQSDMGDNDEYGNSKSKMIKKKNPITRTRSQSPPPHAHSFTDLSKLSRSTGDSGKQFNDSSVKDLVFAKTKCYIQTTASYPKRIKGTCTLKLSYLMFENEDVYKNPLIINIFDILELSQSYNWRVNEPCIMKIVTQSEKFHFYGWQESLQQFLKAYVTKEQLTNSNRIPDDSMPPFMNPSLDKTSSTHPSTISLGQTEVESSNVSEGPFNTANSVAFGSDTTQKIASAAPVELLYQKIIKNFGNEHTIVCDVETDFSVAQLSNCLIGPSELYKQLLSNNGCHTISNSEWAIDVHDKCSSNCEFMQFYMKGLKDINTRILYEMKSPYVPDKLVIFAYTTKCENVPAAGTMTMNGFYVFYSPAALQPTQVKVFMTVNPGGLIFSEQVIRKKSLNESKKRFKKYIKFIEDHSDEIKNNKEYDSLPVKNVPESLKLPEQNLSMQRIKSVMSETPHLNSNLISTESTQYQSKSLNQQLVENVNQFRNYVNHSLAVQCILFVLVVFLVGKLFLPSFRFKSAKNNADVVSETILRIESILENFMDRIDKLEKKIDSNCQQKS